MTFARLSKSRFLIGLQCSKRLWWTLHEPDAPELATDENGVALNRGTQIGELARRHVPGGVLIDAPHYEIDNRIARTAAAISEGARVVYEASFQASGTFVSVDILERRNGAFTLTEVKSTLDVKAEHLPDVAIQAHVLEAAGLDVKRVEVMHLNRECRHPDLSKLFVRENVTKNVRPLLKTVPQEIDALNRALAGPLPDVATGAHCSEPYPCPFQGRCFAALPEHHVSTLHGIRSKKVEKLVADGYETLLDLPKKFKASGPAKRQIKSARTGKLVVARGLKSALAKIKEPIAFLDFETINPAIPAWKGAGPYDQVPVQLSCHLLAEGELEHLQWLADGARDPREPFARALLAACDGAKTIVAYNASFEIQRIAALEASFPELAPQLSKLRKRFVDLLPIVRNHVYHPAFGGSFSIKKVLPALVSGLGYDDLEVQDGATASALLEEFLLHGDKLESGEREPRRTKLLAYCERDTWAMVKLFERLRELR
jgi:Domain of unknown function(DUF2779)